MGHTAPCSLSCKKSLNDTYSVCLGFHSISCLSNKVVISIVRVFLLEARGRMNLLFFLYVRLFGDINFLILIVQLSNRSSSSLKYFQIFLFILHFICVDFIPRMFLPASKSTTTLFLWYPFIFPCNIICFSYTVQSVHLVTVLLKQPLSSLEVCISISIFPPYDHSVS